MKLCDRGCGQPALFFWKRGTASCSKRAAGCPAIKAENSIKAKTIDPITGKTNAEIRSAKAMVTKKTTIDPDTGLTILELSLQKVHEKRKRIDPITGLSFNSLITKKSHVTIRATTGYTENRKKSRATSLSNIDENGLNSYQRSSNARIKSMTADVDDTGLNALQRASEKRIQTLANNVDPITGKTHLELMHQKAQVSNLITLDDDGLNGYERGFKKAKTILFYKDTELYYQGSYEFIFLENLEKTHGLEWIDKNVKRGPWVWYNSPVTNKHHSYQPDFLISGKLYEIKSSYYWNKSGKCITTENINIAKLNACLTSGYKLTLVLNHKHIEWTTTVYI
jgi:hypothetical protein